MVTTTWTQVSRNESRWQRTAGVKSQTLWDNGLTIWDESNGREGETLWDPVFSTATWTKSSTVDGISTAWTAASDL